MARCSISLLSVNSCRELSRSVGVLLMSSFASVRVLFQQISLCFALMWLFGCNHKCLKAWCMFNGLVRSPISSLNTQHVPFHSCCQPFQWSSSRAAQVWDVPFCKQSDKNAFGSQIYSSFCLKVKQFPCKAAFWRLSNMSMCPNICLTNILMMQALGVGIGIPTGNNINLSRNHAHCGWRITWHRCRLSCPSLNIGSGSKEA